MKLKEFQQHKEISPRRKALYYGGTALIALGILCCFGTMLSLILSIGRPEGFMSMGGGAPSQFVWFFAGMVLAVVGGLLQNIGARGLAGSGAVLDPQRAREDLSPYSGALGGMVHDALEGYRQAEGDRAPEESQKELIRVRCRSCRALNTEDARFCDQCGQPL